MIIGHANAVSNFINKGADIHIKNNATHNALHLAAYNGK